MTDAQFDLLLQAFEPLYFIGGLVSGLLIMHLFKGRWLI